MITAIFVMALLAMIVAGLLLYVHQQRIRGIASSRSMKRTSCAEAGLQYARSHFANHFFDWNTYLAKPSDYSTKGHRYNPIASASNTKPANPTDPALRVDKPALFTDLDGDSQPDVYIYIRDNDDEGLPAAQNWERDNDQAVIVGAICISSTLAPRRQDGSVDTNRLTLESILTFNLTRNPYRSQGNVPNLN